MSKSTVLGRSAYEALGKTFVALLGLLVCQSAMATKIVVIGKLVANEPMNYVKDECPQDQICLHSWWKSVIQVDRTVDGKPLTGRITAAGMQHTSMNARYKKAVRLFVLTPIEDPSQREKLRADYYLEEESEPRQMFCLSREPKELGLNAEKTYTSGSDDSAVYCFELPATRP